MSEIWFLLRRNLGRNLFQGRTSSSDCAIDVVKHFTIDEHVSVSRQIGLLDLILSYAPLSSEMSKNILLEFKTLYSFEILYHHNFAGENKFGRVLRVAATSRLRFGWAPQMVWVSWTAISQGRVVTLIKYYSKLIPFCLLTFFRNFLIEDYDYVALIIAKLTSFKRVITINELTRDRKVVLFEKLITINELGFIHLLIVSWTQLVHASSSNVAWIIHWNGFSSADFENIHIRAIAAEIE